MGPTRSPGDAPGAWRESGSVERIAPGRAAPDSQSDEARTDRRGVFATLQVENDLGLTDQYYSHGIQFSTGRAGRPRSALFRAVAGPLDQLGLIRTDSDMRGAWSVATLVFTPVDLQRSTPDPADRPYAGLLIVTPTLASRWDVPAGERMRTVSLQLGWLGPGSQAGEIQRAWHRIIGAPDVEGWPHQLPDEPVAALIVQEAVRFNRRPLPGWVDYEATLQLEGAVGTLQTAAAGRFSVRVGNSLTDDFGPPRLRLGQAPDLFYRRTSHAFTAYAYLSGEARMVAHDVTLNGNVFRESIGVPHEPLVFEGQVGVVVAGRLFSPFWPGPTIWRLSVAHVRRTEVFQGQTEPFVFNAVSLSLVETF